MARDSTSVLDAENQDATFSVCECGHVLRDLVPDLASIARTFAVVFSLQKRLSLVVLPLILM